MIARSGNMQMRPMSPVKVMWLRIMKGSDVR